MAECKADGSNNFTYLEQSREHRDIPFPLFTAATLLTQYLKCADITCAYIYSISILVP